MSLLGRRRGRRQGPAPPSAAENFELIEAPTLILKADAQGETRERNLAVAAKLTHPLSGIVHVEGAGHNVQEMLFTRWMAPP